MSRQKGIPYGLARCLVPPLWLMSRLYEGVVRIRNKIFDGSQPFQNGLYVVSVGNLSTGGTGKTPFCLWLFKKMESLGYRPALVLRGYAASGGLSDEGCVYEQYLGKECVFLTPDRRQGLTQAIEHCFDSAILDDGFQHRRVFRHLDLVLLDVTHLPWEDDLLPLGLFREPLSSLSRAAACVLTRTEMKSEEQCLQIECRLKNKFPELKIIKLRSVIDGFYDTDGKKVELPSRVMAACGLGNPHQFKSMLLDEGIELDDFLIYPDHFAFPDDELNKIEERMKKKNSSALIVTEKDFVKMKDRSNLKLQIARVRFQLNPADEQVLEQLLVRSVC